LVEFTNPYFHVEDKNAIINICMSMIKNGGKVLYTKNLEIGEMHKIKENIWWNSQTPTFI
jgi:hypothetical protein